MYPEYYISRPPDEENLSPVYYKVTDTDPDGHVFWRRKGMSRSKETTFYDLFMEEKNGYGVERVPKDVTPWAD